MYKQNFISNYILQTLHILYICNIRLETLFTLGEITFEISRRAVYISPQLFSPREGDVPEIFKILYR